MILLVTISAPAVVLSQSGPILEWVEWLVIAFLFYLLVTWISSAIAGERDRDWLPGLIMWAFFAKLVASLARHYMVVDLYRTGDSFSYHSQGRIFADVWRSFAIPLSGAGGEGTAFTETVAGLFYAIYTPTMRGGFLFFAFVAFLGQVLFYAAFRPWLKSSQLKRYAIAVLLFPSLLFWPASIGKDALMLFFLGLATLGISRFLRRFDVFGLLYAGTGLFLAAQIRPHIAALLALAAGLAFLLFKRRVETPHGAKRFVPVVVAIVGLAVTWGMFASDFEVSIESGASTLNPGDFLTQVSERTAQGGSQVSGGVVASPTDIPGAIIKVLFRPLIHEGTSPQVIISALEGTLLLLFVIWRLPTVWRNRRMIRVNPFLLLSFFYTGGFILAFSAILNLGILARQRVQVLPFFLALLVTLGWPQLADEPQTDQAHAGRSITTA